VALEEKASSLGWQKATLLTELSSSRVEEIHELSETGPLLRNLTDEFSGFFPTGDEAALVWRANLLPSGTAVFCNRVAASWSGLQVNSHALNGIVAGSLSDDLGAGDAVAMATQLSDLAAESGGNLTIRRCPIEWKRSLPIWGRPPGDYDLMHHVKRTLDPGDVFNPGRLFG
jgi:glycolate oxidase FAD binding subunit